MNPDYTPKSLKELEANEFKDLPAKPGVYIVFWFRGEGLRLSLGF
jgi:hypothetical protein